MLNQPMLNQPDAESRGRTVELKGKYAIALGERDGVQGASIALCAQSAGAQVALEATHCFV